MSRKRSVSPTESVFQSSVIDDRSSRFIGFFSDKADDLGLPENVKGATHRIGAWRRRSKQTSLSSQALFDLGHDDDGETYGGKTLEKVLAARNVEGTVMVARWYGGTLLGPVRFDHMRKCAHEAISNWEAHNQTKRVKTEDGKDELVRFLKERDQSIIALRALLAEKTQSKLDQSQKAASPDYAALPLNNLQRLEQAREKTIAWLLKEIDKTEQNGKRDKVT